MSEYRTIVADPPWEYGSFPTHLGGRYGSGTGTHTKTAMPYPTMTVDEIMALDVDGLAAPDCWLFLWTTGRYLHDAFHIAEAWGFTYRQPFVWRKTGTPTPFPASLAPHHAEFLLACNRGGGRPSGDMAYQRHRRGDGPSLEALTETGGIHGRDRTRGPWPEAGNVQPACAPGLGYVGQPGP